MFLFLQKLMMTVVAMSSTEMSPNLWSRRAGCGASTLVAVWMWLLSQGMLKEEDEFCAQVGTLALNRPFLSPMYPQTCSANPYTSMLDSGPSPPLYHCLT